jgi:SAM-dependent methyltransferase
VSAPSQAVPASFRDPGGRLFRTDNAILRVISGAGADDYDAFASSPAARRFVEQGLLVTATPLDAAEVAALRATGSLAGALEGDVSAVLRHERIAFPSFPYEWPAEMLHAAGLLTLDLAEAVLADGLGLKDATPWNVLFRGASPVFVDWLSVERRDPHDPMWLPSAQFERTFVLPLVAHRELGLSLDQVFLARRDGLEPGDLYRALSRSKRLKPALLTSVTLPAILSRGKKAESTATYTPRRVQDVERANFVLRSALNRLRRAMRRLAPAEAASHWTGYMSGLTHYTDADFARKVQFVRAALASTRPSRVLDVGCNTGHFSALAAQSGASVVGIDGDAAVAGHVWRRANAEQLDILPLVVNLARPSPATGWRNAESPSFLERATGHFDLVLMLAVLHHLLVTERVPLEDVLALAADLTRDSAVIEFVAPEDPMFRRLTRGREHLHAGLTAEVFERAAAAHFDIAAKEAAEGGTRVLYYLRRRR